MKKPILLLLLFCSSFIIAQEKTFEKEVAKISKKIELITKQQKDSLKTKVLAIDKQLEKGEITETTAQTLKKEVAAYHARRIEVLVGEQEQLLQKLVQQKTEGKIATSDDNDNYIEDEEFNVLSIGNKTFKFKVNEGPSEESVDRKKERWKLKQKYQRSTTTQFIFAMGINNVLQNGSLSSLNDSEYQVGRSRFYEVGFSWKTRFSKEPSQLYFKYGFSFLWNNLRLEGNRIHVKNGDMTEIQQFSEPLTESRLRHVQMIFPMHIEWDLSKNGKFRSGRLSDRTNESFRVGLGGFFGFKLGTRQYLEFRDGAGVDVEQVQFDNFNMNVFNYGLSGYVGYKDIAFYVKYDLNPLFQDTDINNISMGLRLDLD